MLNISIINSFLVFRGESRR